MNSLGYFLPEWASVKTVLIAWPYPGSDWDDVLDRAQDCYWGILTNLSRHIHVTLLLHPKLSKSEFLEILISKNISQGNVTVINDLEYDDTWIRDYGPISMSRGYQTFTFNGWGGKYSALNDNLIAKSLEQYIGAVHNQAFVLEGGALETDAQYLLLNKDCVIDKNRNPDLTEAESENFLIEALGCQNILWVENICLTGDDTDGHIDTLARFAPNQQVLYAGPNELHSDNQILLLLQKQIKSICERVGYKALPLPSPIVNSQVDGRPLPATYVNFLIVNKFVFVPTYGISEDQQALEIISQAFSEFSVEAIRCETLLEQHGSLHCATMQIAELSGE